MQTEAKISPEELLAEGRTIQIKPQGYSMYPLFVPGRDSAVIAPPEKSGRQGANLRYRRGDVVLYRGRAEADFTSDMPPEKREKRKHGLLYGGR